MCAVVEVIRRPDGPKAEFSAFFQSAPVGLALCHRHGRMTLNPALERMSGMRSGISPPLQLADLLHPEERPECARLMAELLEGARSDFQIDSQVIGVNNRAVRWTVWKLVGASGAADSLLAMAEDLTSIAAAEQRVRQAERMEAVGRLAGGVAHDFNNLLTGVLLYCDLLAASLESGHRARKYAEEIRKAGLQASGLVRQLLAVSRPTNSQPRLLSLNEVAEGMGNLLTRLIGENIELKLQLDPNLNLIRMDATQMQQILLNLVLNARDALPGGGTIEIETRNCNVEVLTDSGAVDAPRTSLACALMVVEDNGMGMDESTRSHLFEPFFTTKAGKGTGLGLSTVHNIVTAHGGLVHVASKIGEGTRVSVLLPLVPEEVVPEDPTADGSLQSKPRHESLPASPAAALSFQEED